MSNQLFGMMSEEDFYQSTMTQGVVNVWRGLTRDEFYDTLSRREDGSVYSNTPIPPYTPNFLLEMMGEE